jgi:hypothetical protein
MKTTRLIFILLTLTFACKQKEQVGEPAIAFVGATIIDGTGADPLQDGVLLIRN